MPPFTVKHIVKLRRSLIFLFFLSFVFIYFLNQLMIKTGFSALAHSASKRYLGQVHSFSTINAPSFHHSFGQQNHGKSPHVNHLMYFRFLKSKTNRWQIHVYSPKQIIYLSFCIHLTAFISQEHCTNRKPVFLSGNQKFEKLFLIRETLAKIFRRK